MNIFIDGYNILKQLYAVKHVSAGQKDLFMHQLKRFASGKGHHIYLVYDGGESSRPELEHLGLVTLIYSGYKLTADQVIQQKMAQYRPENTLLVSDDRQLCDHIAMAGFASLGTANFYHLMKADLQQNQTKSLQQGIAQKKPGYASTPELDELMQQAGSMGYYKNDELIPERSYQRQLSKKEKKLGKLVKKI